MQQPEPGEKEDRVVINPQEGAVRSLDHSLQFIQLPFFIISFVIIGSQLTASRGR